MRLPADAIPIPFHYWLSFSQPGHESATLALSADPLVAPISLTPVPGVSQLFLQWSFLDGSPDAAYRMSSALFRFGSRFLYFDGFFHLSSPTSFSC
jgi:hypothetical protein